MENFPLSAFTEPSDLLGMTVMALAPWMPRPIFIMSPLVSTKYQNDSSLLTLLNILSPSSPVALPAWVQVEPPSVEMYQ